jgi:Ribosomal protein S7e
LYSQVDISGNRKAVVIHVPYRLRKGFKKIHVRLVRELEKKFSGKVSLSFTEKEKKLIRNLDANLKRNNLLIFF